MELTSRKKSILKVVIEEYVETAEPVSSKSIARQMGGSISSATIRNELADLVELGYLEQPHTSAGRIPTPQGYRLYVNELMERRQLSPREAEDIENSLRTRMAELDRVIFQASQVVSTLVNYPAYISASGRSGGMVQRFELLPVDHMTLIAVVMTEDDRVKSKVLHPEFPMAPEQLKALAEELNRSFTGLTGAQMMQQLMQCSATVEPTCFMLMNQVVDYAVSVLQESSRGMTFTTGASHILTLPEYRDVDKAQQLMRFLSEQPENLPVPEEGTPIKILIGPENVSEELKDTSVVMASCDIGDHRKGIIGVVGPTRMDYATVAARLSFFAEGMSRMFGNRKEQLPPKEEHS